MIKLVIVEQDVNYPTVLGRLNIPRKQMWPAGAKIGNIPSVIAAGMDRSFLPQALTSRGLLGRLTRRRQVVGEDLSLDGEYSTRVHNAVSAQTQRNIPAPWGPRSWRPGALIENLPSVIQTGITSGPTRTMHGKLIPTGMSVEL